MSENLYNSQQNKEILENLYKKIDELESELESKERDHIRQLKEIIRSEEYYRHIAENSTDLIILNDETGKNVFVSTSCKNITGYTREEFFSKNDFLFNISHKEDLSILSDHKSKINDTEIKEIEFRIECKDGTIKWISHQCHKVINSDGKYIGKLSCNRDITERKLTEEKYLQVFEASSSIIGITSLESAKIIDINPAFINATGFQKAEVLNKSTFDMDIWADFRQREEIINEVRNNGIIKNKEVNIKSKSGKLITCLVSAETITIKNEKCILFIANDITERKKAEERFKTAIETMIDPFGIFELVKDEYEKIVDLKYTYVNDAACKNYRLNREDIIGRTMTQLFPNTKNSRILKDYISVAETGNPFVNDSLFYTDKFGDQILTMAFYIRAAKLEDGIAISWIDITERKKAEEELKKYAENLKKINASKDKFFSIISHDLKSPFLGLMGITELLCEEYDTLPDKEIKYYHEILHFTTENLYNLVENLLQWSRLQLGKIEFNPKKVDLNLQIDALLGLYIGNAIKKEIVIINNVTPGLLINTDLNMFSSIMQNLVSNAIKFTNKYGKIEITAVKKASYVEISVRDTGVGIAEENLNKLFVIDKQFTTQGTMDETGTGLGLILCKELVEKHGGSIWATSRIGKGSKFIFTIPAAE